MKHLLTAITSLLLASLAACSTVQTTQSGAIGVERKQYMLVSEAQVEQGAAESYQQELAGAKQKGALNVDQQQVLRVRTITNRLIPHTTAFRADAKQWQWEINVQKTDELNAYCMPGGKIMVYSGIIEKLQLSDAELAAIIGHEIAHALREHTRERVSRAYAEQVGLGVLAAVTGAGAGAMQLASTVTQVTFGLPHSREQETESDRIGLELMARAGYDPHAAITLWQKMSQQSGNTGSDFLSTHPSSSNRIADLQANLPKVLPLYQAANKP
ncbi:MAG: M48 family metallopeptidase [Steroidobacteraceae bacterium]